MKNINEQIQAQLDSRAQNMLIAISLHIYRFSNMVIRCPPWLRTYSQWFLATSIKMHPFQLQKKLVTVSGPFRVLYLFLNRLHGQRHGIHSLARPGSWASARDHFLKIIRVLPTDKGQMDIGEAVTSAPRGSCSSSSSSKQHRIHCAQCYCA